MNGGEPVTILVVGGGGREHALCWKLAQSAHCRKILCAPGNAGTAGEGGVTNVPIGAHEFDRLIELCAREKVDLVVVGPDDPLAAGIVDRMEASGLRVFGPTQAQARLEWSKSYAKDFLRDNDIPTARYAVAESIAEAKSIVGSQPWARVIKADGLALGKGVYVCDSRQEALAALQEIFTDRKFGASGNRVVIEERLSGEEISLIILCDGRHLRPLPPCQDHKRRFDGDRGPNTGGMGVYAPVRLYDRCADAVERSILTPLRQALADGRLSFKGVLYIGLMVETVRDEPATRGTSYRPYVLEFNARFGDPETQALLPLMTSDLLPALWACTDGTLDQAEIQWSGGASCCVVAAAGTYPEAPSRGSPIEIGDLPEGTFVFHAGTRTAGGVTVTDGGRVLAVTGTAPSMESARERAYAAFESIDFEGMDYRKDIAARAAGACQAN